MKIKIITTTKLIITITTIILEKRIRNKQSMLHRKIVRMAKAVVAKETAIQQTLSGNQTNKAVTTSNQNLGVITAHQQ